MSIRAQVRANTLVQLQDYQAANPNAIRAVYDHRPGSFRELPCAYVGDISITFRHIGSTLRQTSPDASVEIIVAADVVDADESKDEVDTIAQGLADQIGALPHYLGSNTSWDTISISDLGQSVGPVEYTGAVVTISGITIQEGGF